MFNTINFYYYEQALKNNEKNTRCGAPEYGITTAGNQVDVERMILTE